MLNIRLVNFEHNQSKNKNVRQNLPDIKLSGLKEQQRHHQNRKSQRGDETDSTTPLGLQTVVDSQ